MSKIHPSGEVRRVSNHTLYTTGPSRLAAPIEEEKGEADNEVTKISSLRRGAIRTSGGLARKLQLAEAQRHRKELDKRYFNGMTSREQALYTGLLKEKKAEKSPIKRLILDGKLYSLRTKPSGMFRIGHMDYI